jgi:hypothetical protein
MKELATLPHTQKAARSYAALRRAAHYPLSLHPYCKTFMAFFLLEDPSSEFLVPQQVPDSPLTRRDEPQPAGVPRVLSIPRRRWPHD